MLIKKKKERTKKGRDLTQMESTIATWQYKFPGKAWKATDNDYRTTPYSSETQPERHFTLSPPPHHRQTLDGKPS